MNVAETKGAALPQELRAEPGTFESVLVVDDSRAQRRMLSASLKRWGFHVTEAGTGDEALALCRERVFDLVISDWMMPGLTGPEFCKAFRALGGDRYGYFILVTSKNDKVDMVAGLEIGADDFLSKPVSAEELRARINAGARVLRMERELTEKNRIISQALEEVQTLYGALDRDLQEARKLQQSLVPERSRAIGGSRVSLLFEPCGHVGGDLVGAFPVTDHVLGLFAIDVSGHGVASALLTARLAGLLTGASPDRNLALTERDGALDMLPPEAVCSRLNRMMLEEIETDLYFTIALARVDLADGQVQIAQAGHPSPIVQRRDGRVERLGDGGLPIGLLPGASYSAFELTLAPGERLFLYSDGITECAAADGRHFEEEGLVALFERHRDVPGDGFVAQLGTALRRFSSGAEMADDVSGVLFEYGGPD